MSNTNDQTAAVVADIQRRADEATPPQPFDLAPEKSVVVRTLRNDERVDTTDLENLLDQPRRPRGTALLTDPSDFAAYVTRLATASTTVWADQDSLKVTATFNDHANGFSAGWRDHRAVLKLKHDDDWKAWLRQDGSLLSQEDFAEHLEDRAHTIVNPDTATMLEIALTFQTRRNASFSRGARLNSGDVQLAWSEETTAKAGASGRLEVPAEFTIAVAPFFGLPATEVTARLRWRIRDGQLGIGYRLDRPDLVHRKAFADVRQMLADSLDAPVLLGAAPRLEPFDL
ncbi:YfdQ family protein [Amycolatopsis sp. NPDC059021]|uniref:YfdQ family protein n=1 Tax=Amycolatopsis sp. NPDC059021 TaxID=3346704 RepID=UPI0036717CB9